MTIGMLCSSVAINIYYEMNGNPAIDKLGIAQQLGSMEGKEVRFGPAASAFWSIVTTITSTGSVNAMHDSSMPLSGGMMHTGYDDQCILWWCGVGILNYFIFIIIAVFISGLDGWANTGIHGT